jgi:hypothetical protein
MPSLTAMPLAPVTVYVPLDQLEELQALLWDVRKVTGRRLSMTAYARLAMAALRPRLRAISAATAPFSREDVEALLSCEAY